MKLKSVRSNVRAAAPPRPPARTARMLSALEKRLTALREAGAIERESLLRGLLLVALLVGLIVLWKAGSDRAFMPAWWQQ